MKKLGTGTVQPTMPVYAKVLGFSSYVVGVIFTILPILGLIIKPAFGALADRVSFFQIIINFFKPFCLFSISGIEVF